MRTTLFRLAAVIIASLAMALPAQAAFEYVSRAYEVKARNFVAPVTPNAGFVVKTCDDCASLRLRTTVETRYSFDGKWMSLERFRDTLQKAPADQVSIGVLHHLETDTVLRIFATQRVEQAQ